MREQLERMAFCVAVASLVCGLLAATPAAADGAQLLCDGCSTLPEGFTIELERCQLEAPLVFGEKPAVALTSIGSGRFNDVDVGGEGVHPVRLWTGVSDAFVPYWAVFEGDSTEASACNVVSGFESVTRWGATISAPNITAMLPYLTLSSYVRIGYCGGEDARASIAWLALQKKWVTLQTSSIGNANFCPDATAPPSEDQKALKRHQQLQREGLAAYRAHDFAKAEARWREALPLPEAVNDLGVLLSDLRPIEAEPLLIQAAADDYRSAAWLNLADLYWRTDQRPLAKHAYRQYLDLLLVNWRPLLEQKKPVPVERAVHRATPAKAQKR